MSFCRTRVQVGKYSRLECLDEKCPTCGHRESVAHILVCPNEDRTHLLADTMDDLSYWLNQDYLTDLELAYLQWIYRNFALHDKLCSYLDNKSLKVMRVSI